MIRKRSNSTHTLKRNMEARRYALHRRFEARVDSVKFDSMGFREAFHSMLNDLRDAVKFLVTTSSEEDIKKGLLRKAGISLVTRVRPRCDGENMVQLDLDFLLNAREADFNEVIAEIERDAKSSPLMDRLSRTLEKWNSMSDEEQGNYVPVPGWFKKLTNSTNPFNYFMYDEEVCYEVEARLTVPYYGIDKWICSFYTGVDTWWEENKHADDTDIDHMLTEYRRDFVDDYSKEPTRFYRFN